MILGFLRDSLFYLFLYAILSTIIMTDHFITKENKRIFMIAIGLGILNMVTQYTELWTDTHPETVFLREWASYTGYSLRPFLIFCYLKLCLPNHKHHLFHGIAVLSLILFFTSHYTHLCVYFTEDNIFHRGPLWISIFIICGLGLLSLTVLSFLDYYQRNIRRWILPPICSFLILQAVYGDLNGQDLVYPSSLNETLVIVMFLFYLFYHLHLAEQYEEKMIQNQQLQLMISQIKPHFFFNTITTIQALCTVDPKKASDTLQLFASYVRQNLTTQTEHLIPFTKELQHVKTYVEIETLRFPNIEVQYDLQVTEFEIAALSVQPLVENAIKHGIRSRDHGIVKVSTQQLDKTIKITISDNGVGFDTAVLDTLDESHVGIRNVQSRLKILQKADLKVDSNSEGTTITITIPWEN